MRNILYFLNPVRLFRRFVIRRGNLNRFRNLVNRSETTGGMTENKSIFVIDFDVTISRK